MYSEFAGRNAVYERNYAGNQDQQRLDALRWANMRGDTDRYKDVVQQSLDDYDLDGWKQGYLD
jgi:4-hydroxyphenylacetate 3-monooxygenase